MGSILSNVNSYDSSPNHKIYSSKGDDYSSCSDTWHVQNEMSNFDLSGISDLWVDILSFVPATDLLRNCRNVCKEWREILDGHSVWKLKCVRERKCIPNVCFKTIPLHYYRNIYFKDPYGRNLIKNPNGVAGYDYWTVIRDGGGSRAIVENPPEGSEPVPQEVGTQCCFVTSYVSCVKLQIVNLQACGIADEILQLKNTKIHVGEWYAARFDCAAEYRLTVILLDKNFDIEEYEEQEDENYLAEDQTLKDHTIDTFEFYFREEQWVGKKWHLVSHVFENVGDVGYVYFQHYGKDCQFWAGNYGIKMTGAFVKVLTEN